MIFTAAGSAEKLTALCDSNVTCGTVFKVIKKEAA